MSKDIRSFFQVVSKKPGDHSKFVEKPKRARKLIDSDDDDVVEVTPEKNSSKTLHQTKRKVQVLSSDSEDEKSKKKKTPEKKKTPIKKQKQIEEKPKLRPVNLDVLNKPVKQSKVEYVPKPETSKQDKDIDKKAKKKDGNKSKNKKNTEVGIHDDANFEKTLEELDEDSDDTILLDNLDILDKTIEFASKSISEDSDMVQKEEKNYTKDQQDDEKHKVEYKQTNKGVGKNEIKNTEHKDNNKELSQDKKGGIKDRNQEKEESQVREEKKDIAKTHDKSNTPKKAEKRQRKASESTPTPRKKKKLDHTDSGIDSELQKSERKRHSAALYQNYLHRGGPKNHGMKEYPKGKPDCLRGLTFLRTGVLDSLEGDEFQSLVSDHGGRVVHSLSKKVNYVVVGEDPGPAKMEKAQIYKIQELSEDQFLDMILVKSEMKPKYVLMSESDDLGLGDSVNGSDDFTELLKDEVNSGILEESFKQASHNISGTPTETKPANDKKIDDKLESSVKDEASSIANKPASKHTIEIGSNQSLSWTDKYKPSSTKEIIGQQDSNSNMNKLKRWLENWQKNQDPERRKTMAKPNPFKSCGNGEYYKAALLSGSPGVGKTTTATLVAKELGYDIVEFNASDTRNKKLLHEEISQMMNSRSLAGFATGENNVNKKRVLLMDEVDGMAGNEDRGGIAELISFIKTASFPIICMCNNREHQKMRTLVTHCFELKFGKPNVQQVRGSMLSICFKEGLKIKPDALARLIMGTGCDIRQTLNHLAMWSAAEKDISSDVVQKESKNSQKDVVMGPWDVIRTVFTKSMNKDMSLSDKSRLFFYDYSLGPLFVQENYINVKPDCIGKGNRDEEEAARLYLTADSLSMSDLIETKIRTTNNWSLLESQAFFSTVIPSHYMSGTMKKCGFPNWFGSNSRRNKKMRIVNELYAHARTRISGDKNSFHLEYAEPLRDLLLRPLKEKGSSGVKETFEVMQNYSLLRDDMINLFELLNRFEQPNYYERIPINVKTALTKLYNKKMVLSFAPPVASKKKGKVEDELFVEEDDLSDEEEKEENVDDDTLIKVKTKNDAKAGSSKASGSKQETKGKGKTTKTAEGKTSKGRGKK